ncbi:OmpW family protein [Ralstonia solanacearum]|uniref:OmpW/AlkL family protein n=1 Tax=Ralstonia solanacearum TaxID=305 RepID=UPI0001816492|nr:OmpW family protein [Ralstonia solanacearum]MDC6177683.1 OmpW family protein [Ralstonia solanacearum]MDC6209529.1 OmpW family protein [Ralstonia solanacearum]MDC6238575.1 OmpW family protein [Ralstonia solanacearum]MDD7799936.1 OmpW family protein [Ralstonia solanacearum]TYZ56439.1 OmpW family protein [Ralstonia solanacearum]
MACARPAIVAAAASLVAAAVCPTAYAEGIDLPPATGNWMVRLRAVNLTAANKSDAIPALAVPDDAIHINNKAFPELDISYFFTPNLAAELILTYPQQQDVTVMQSALGGPTKIGSFRHLPPILTLQYHFRPESRFKPYLGAGLNYTRISGVDLQVPGVGPLDLSRNSFGPALQAGFDYRLTDRIYLNVDIKKTWISADVKLAGQTISKVRVDPWLVGVGLGYRF